MGSFALAEKYFNICKNIREELLEPDHEELGNIYNNLGNLAYSRLQYDRAFELQSKAATIRMAHDNEWDTSKAMSHLNLGRVLWRLGKFEDARKRLKMAVDLFTRSGNWYLLAQ